MKAKWIQTSEDTFSLLTPFGWTVIVYQDNPDSGTYWLHCPTLFSCRQHLCSNQDDAKLLAIERCKDRLEYIAKNLDKLEPV